MTIHLQLIGYNEMEIEKMFQSSLTTYYLREDNLLARNWQLIRVLSCIIGW